MATPSNSESRRTRFEEKIEVVAALLLAVATVFSTWSSYEAHRWGGVQALTMAKAAANRVRGEDALVRANQYVQLDVAVFLQYLEAQSRGEQSHAEFLEKRFRPELRAAVDAWRATNPLTNPDAPPGPFSMPEYRFPMKDEAERLIALADQQAEVAAQANAQGDSYVLLTVLFASVLFFGGIGTKFESRRLRLTWVGLGLVILLGAVVGLSRLPVR